MSQTAPRASSLPCLKFAAATSAAALRLLARPDTLEYMMYVQLRTAADSHVCQPARCFVLRLPPTCQPHPNSEHAILGDASSLPGITGMAASTPGVQHCGTQSETTAVDKQKGE